MKTVVLSLGGSILFPTLANNTLRSYVPVLRQLAQQYRLFVVVGGGGGAREYIGAVRGLGIDEGTCDEIGILVTRLNATLLIAALGDAAYPKVPVSHSEAIAAAATGRIVVMGGITPGQTTDAVAAVLAERTQADVLFNLTSVNGIYDKDPNKFADAVLYDHLTPEGLMKTIGGAELNAGANTVIDIVAAKIIARCGIPLIVIDGRDASNLEQALTRGRFTGTVVSVALERILPL